MTVGALYRKIITYIYHLNKLTHKPEVFYEKKFRRIFAGILGGSVIFNGSMFNAYGAEILTSSNDGEELLISETEYEEEDVVPDGKYYEAYDGPYYDMGKYQLGYSIKNNSEICIEAIKGDIYDDSDTYTDLIIPDYINGLPVTEIGEWAIKVYYNGKLKLPSHLKRIDKDAFTDSSFTGGLVIPDSVEVIEQNAFAHCCVYGQLIMSRGIVSIGGGSMPDDLEGEINLPEGLKTIGGSAFKKSKITGELRLPSTLESIGQSAFEGATISGDLIIPSSLSVLHADVFKDCLELNGDVVIPDSIKEIGDGAFSMSKYKNPKIKDFYIMDGVSKIGENAFECFATNGEPYFSSAKYHCIPGSYAYNWLDDFFALVADKRPAEQKTVHDWDGNYTPKPRRSYFVRFYSKDNTEEIKVQAGAGLTRPESPSADDEGFLGWYVEGDLNKPFDFDNSTVTSDLYLYAKYDNDETYYDAKFYSDGECIQTVSVKAGDKLNRISDPVKEDLKLVGWYIDDKFTYEYDFSKPVTGNLELYAKWEDACKNEDVYEHSLGFKYSRQKDYLNNVQLVKFVRDRTKDDKSYFTSGTYELMPSKKIAENTNVQMAEQALAWYESYIVPHKTEINEFFEDNKQKHLDCLKKADEKNDPYKVVTKWFPQKLTFELNDEKREFSYKSVHMYVDTGSAYSQSSTYTSNVITYKSETGENVTVCADGVYFVF